MKYKIVEGGNTKELEKNVRDFIENGWKPIGGISIASWMIGDERFWLLSQAMIYEE